MATETRQSRLKSRAGVVVLLLASGAWVVATATNSACTMHGSRGLSQLLHKLCEAGGPWAAATIPALIFLVLLAGAWFSFRAK